MKRKDFAHRMMLIHRALKESRFKPLNVPTISHSVRVGVAGPTFAEIEKSIK